MSEIKICAFNFAPKGWALCNGQTLPINQNQALFSLLGTTFGGNGQTTFALPDLRGRAGMHTGRGHILGERGGQDSHTVTQAEMPAHIHPATADVKSGNNTTDDPTNTYPANIGGTPMYSPGSNNMQAMFPTMVTNTGGSQAHENRQPYLALNFCIALQGVFPSRN